MCVHDVAPVQHWDEYVTVQPTEEIDIVYETDEESVSEISETDYESETEFYIAQPTTPQQQYVFRELTRAEIDQLIQQIEEENHYIRLAEEQLRADENSLPPSP